MPGKATIKGTLKDINDIPIVGGKVIATMVGSDAFEGGVRIAGRKIDATTGMDGRWSLDLLVNGEGRHGSSSWKIEAFDNVMMSIFSVDKLFVINTAEMLLDDLEQVTAANEVAAKAAGMSRILAADDLAEYQAMPEAQRRPTDIVFVKDV
ncbi:hypothetical protein [Paracoccus sp. 22332]|uniref:hypothetical protein n=1 Tax=Paracoccus sp. 22332 TaxID=3453913 RepID=UPI003F8410BE